MKGNDVFEALKKNLNRGKDEVVRGAKIGRLKLEIASINRKIEEKYKTLGRRVCELIEKDEMDLELFEPDYDVFKKLQTSLAEVNHKIDKLKEEMTPQEDDDKDTEDAPKDDEEFMEGGVHTEQEYGQEDIKNEGEDVSNKEREDILNVIDELTNDKKDVKED